MYFKINGNISIKVTNQDGDKFRALLIEEATVDVSFGNYYSCSDGNLESITNSIKKEMKDSIEQCRLNLERREKDDA